MFPSPNSYNPFDHQNSSSSLSSFDHQNPNNTHSKTDHHHHHDPPFLFTFPSPFLDEHEEILPLNQILLQNHLTPITTMDHTDPTKKNEEREKKKEPIVGKSGPSIRRSRNLSAVPRRRAGKKDRHSKICTAQGIRDRRMRLSLQVARKFFDLQDMLGYDKASKTIEWLFTKSKQAIKELIKDHPQAELYYNNNYNTSSDERSESFVSECEVVSGLIEENNNNNISSNDVKESVLAGADAMPICVNSSEREERENPKPGSEPNSRRERARARARSRTREKMMVKILEDSGNIRSNPSDDRNDNFRKLGFLNSAIFEGVDQESNFNYNQERAVSLYGNLYSSLEQQFGDVGTIEKFLVNSTTSSSTLISPNYDYDQNPNFMGVLSNWDMLGSERSTNLISSADNITLTHQFARPRPDNFQGL